MGDVCTILRFDESAHQTLDKTGSYCRQINSEPKCLEMTVRNGSPSLASAGSFPARPICPRSGKISPLERTRDVPFQKVAGTSPRTRRMPRGHRSLIGSIRPGAALSKGSNSTPRDSTCPELCFRDWTRCSISDCMPPGQRFAIRANCFRLIVRAWVSSWAISPFRPNRRPPFVVMFWGEHSLSE